MQATVPIYAVTISVVRLDPSAWSDLSLISYKPKTFRDEDVELVISHCGVCGSDVHTLTQGWGNIRLPLVPGHEIVGKVTRVGSKVTEFKVGDRVGVGAQIGSCMQCRACKSDNENYCLKMIDTYVCGFYSYRHLSVTELRGRTMCTPTE